MADQGSSFIGSALVVGALAWTWLAPSHAVAQAFARPSAPESTLELDDGAAKESAEILFTGYQSLANGRGLLFVELTEAVSVEVKRAGRVIEYRMMGARVPLKNNKNPLLLRDFNSSALSAVLVVEKAARGTKAQPVVKLVVTLRSDVSPAHRMAARGRGATLEIDLPPPK
jgi:hypothetical protein